jgi:hypothetical protein
MLCALYAYAALPAPVANRHVSEYTPLAPACRLAYAQIALSIHSSAHFTLMLRCLRQSQCVLYQNTLLLLRLGALPTRKLL